VDVLSEEHGNRRYYILHLPYRKKILPWRSSDYDEMGRIVETPPLSAQAIGKHKVFTYLHPERWHEVLMTEEVVTHLIEAQLTGLAFIPAPVSNLTVTN
jgi:hypothetical protein